MRRPLVIATAEPNSGLVIARQRFVFWCHSEKKVALAAKYIHKKLARAAAPGSPSGALIVAGSAGGEA